MRKIFAVVAGCMLLAGVALITGCEDDEISDAEFRITPSEVTSDTSTDFFVFEAIGGKPPFTWTLSDSTLGTLTGEGRVVTYTRNGKEGDNIIRVTDEKQWTASARVSQHD